MTCTIPGHIGFGDKCATCMKEASIKSRKIESASIWQVMKCTFGRHTYKQQRTDEDIYGNKKLIFCCGFCPHETVKAEIYLGRSVQ